MTSLPMEEHMRWFVEARYGMFVHFGLYSLLGRGEWVMNREQIPPDEYRKLADRFHPDRFDADALCRLAVESGMTYVVFTTMHHDGFRMYHTEQSDFCSTKTADGRDFTAEIIAACRRHQLRIGLYHSLNNWFDQPDGVAALEERTAYERFIERTFARLRELLERYRPVDIMWYDGWWPFDDRGWRAEEMNAMVSSIQPGIVINGRNGLPGDFATPEQHLTAPSPWRPWEACLTLNEHWGFHAADDEWKSPGEIVGLLARVAGGAGNLLLNIGPRGDGSVPEPSERVLRRVGRWIREEGGREALFDTDPFAFGYHSREEGPGDFDPHVSFTARENILHAIVRFWPGPVLTIAGVEMPVRQVTAGDEALPFTHRDGILRIELPGRLRETFCPVLAVECTASPSVYRTGGMRTPAVPHPRYDPVASDLLL